jgi:putative flippase GtrA
MKTNLRYLLNTGFAAAVDFGSLFVIHQLLKVDITIAVAISFSLAFVANFFGSKLWVFKTGDETERKKGSLPKFALLTGANLLIQTVGVTALVNLGLYYLLAKCLLVGLMFFVNYFVSKKVIF